MGSDKAMNFTAKFEDGVLELSSISECGGPVVRCFPDGRIELFEIPQYGGEERKYGNYPTVCAALKVAETFT